MPATTARASTPSIASSPNDEHSLRPAGRLRQPGARGGLSDRRNPLFRGCCRKLAWAFHARRRGHVEEHPPLKESRTEKRIALLDANVARQIVKRHQT